MIFPNPNAPTGVYMPLDQVEEILKANQDVVVIVDEAYVDFAGPSALELLDKYENLFSSPDFQQVPLHGRYAYWFCNGTSGSDPRFK